MNEYTEARKRIPDENAIYVYRVGRGFSYKEAPDWRSKMKGVITYPCCPFCGKRVGEDNKDFNSGTFCDRSCYIAYEMHVNKKDFTNEELIREEQLKQLLFIF